MATGHRVSQLAALLRSPEFTRFGPGLSSVTQVPRPAFLAKNEREGHRVGPVTVLAWRACSVPHALCPVAALSDFLESTRLSRADELWVRPDSLSPLGVRGLAALLVRLIRDADPGSRPRAHQVRKYAASLAFFRSFDVDRVRRAGQWSSPASFISRYLVTHLRDAPCVALGARPVP